MPEARLAAGVEVSGLLRQADAQGGFGTVLHKGDAERGALLIVVLERGRPAGLLERMLQRDGSYRWERSASHPADSAGSTQYLARRQTADPDCWIVELDIPSGERFIAEMIASA